MLKKNIFVIIFVLISTISINYFYNLYVEHKKSIVNNQVNNLQHLYQAAITTYRLNAKSVFDNIIMQEDVLSILEKVPNADKIKTTKLHYELYDLLQSRYLNLKESLYIRQLHFHQTDGRSFLRMHRKDKYNDKLFDIRYSVKIANTQKVYIEGFEEGRIFNGYRYVYPIIHNNRHLGSVEISVSINAIISQLAQIFNNKSFYFAIDKNIINEKVFASEKSNYKESQINQGYVVDKEVKTMFDMKYNEYLQKLNNKEIEEKMRKHQAIVESISLKETVIVTFLPMYNIEKDFVAYLISFEKSKNILNHENQFLYQIFISLFMSTLILGTLFFLQERSRFIEKEKIILNKLVIKRTKELEIIQKEKVQSYRDIILAMVNLTEERDTYTAGHTRRVAEYSKLIAIEMGYSDKEVDNLYEAAILHDIGKIVTPDSVLLKPGDLNFREYEIIKKHVSIGESILSSINLYEKLVDIVKYHHERYDGSGYPYGIKAHEIPPLARVLAVADTFDAMTTNRIYKPRKDIDIALAELKSLSGIHYEPNVVNAAIKVLHNIQINLDITQLPTNIIEDERLAQFFKDPLTSLYNLKYLHLILKHGLNKEHFTCANIISIQNFTKFNNEHSWEEGDMVLKRLSDFLLNMFSQSMIFRIFGDDFVVLSTLHVEINKEELQKKFRKTCKYDIELNLSHHEILSKKDRSNLIIKLEDEIG